MRCLNLILPPLCYPSLNIISLRHVLNRCSSDIVPPTPPPLSFWITRNKRKNNKINKLLWLHPLHHPFATHALSSPLPLVMRNRMITSAASLRERRHCCEALFFMITLRRAPRPVQRRESVRYTLLYGRRRQDSYSGCAVWKTVLYAMARWGLGKSAPVEYFSIELTLRPPVGDHSKVIIMGLNWAGWPATVCVPNTLEKERLYTQFPY